VMLSCGEREGRLLVGILMQVLEFPPGPFPHRPIRGTMVRVGLRVIDPEDPALITCPPATPLHSLLALLA